MSEMEVEALDFGEEVEEGDVIRSPLRDTWDPETLKEGSKYLCGGCGAKNAVKFETRVRCESCGYRIMYKARQRRPMLFLAK